MIIEQTESDIRVITLDDPESKNSFSESLTKALSAALASAAADSAIRAIIVTARGSVFCSGGNLKSFQAIQGDRGDYVAGIMDTLYTPLALQLDSLTKPLIVAMNGPAIGAGVGLALNADFTLAAQNAWFSLPFVPALGIVPDFGCGQLLVRALGYRRALALTLSGEKLGADEALRSGLVSGVHASEKLQEEALVLAERLASLPAETLARTKTLLKAADREPFRDYLALERELQIACFRESALSEGLAAIRERRSPDFQQVDTSLPD